MVQLSLSFLYSSESASLCFLSALPAYCLFCKVSLREMFPGIFLNINLISLAVYSSTPYKNGHPALSTAAAFAAWATQSKSFFDFIGKCFGWIMVLIVWAAILYCMSLMVRFLTYVWDTVLSIFARLPSSHPPATVETPREPYKEHSASLPTPPPSSSSPPAPAFPAHHINAGLNQVLLAETSQLQPCILQGRCHSTDKM